MNGRSPQVNTDAEAALAGLAKPTVAFISGDCIGGGCALAIDCDLRVATSDARFGITPAKLGIVYPSASLERAMHLLGPAVTKRLLFTGDLINAAEALRVGLIDEIVDTADGVERLATLTGVLAARSLLTQAATKSMVAAIKSHGHVPDDVQKHWSEVAAVRPTAPKGSPRSSRSVRPGSPGPGPMATRANASRRARRCRGRRWCWQ